MWHEERKKRVEKKENEESSLHLCRCIGSYEIMTKNLHDNGLLCCIFTEIKEEKKNKIKKLCSM